MKQNQLAVIAFAGLRGAATIAFAISVVNSDTPSMNDFYHIVCDICLLSSLIQGRLLPVLSKKTDMVDPEDTSLRNFNSLQDKSDVDFLATKIKADNRLMNSYIRDINLAFDFIIAKILRQSDTIVLNGVVQLQRDSLIVLVLRNDNELAVPNGDIRILEGDTVL